MNPFGKRFLLFLFVLVFFSSPVSARELVATLSPSQVEGLDIESKVFLIRSSEDWDVFQLEVKTTSVSRDRYLGTDGAIQHRASITIPSYFQILENEVSEHGEPIGKFVSGLSDGVYTLPKRWELDGLTNLTWVTYFPEDAHPEVKSILTYSVEFLVPKGDLYGEPQVQIDTTELIQQIGVEIQITEGYATAGASSKSLKKTASAKVAPKGATLTMAYGTTRNRLPGSARTRYGKDPSGRLEVGTLKVTLPCYAPRKGWEDAADAELFDVNGHSIGAERLAEFLALESKKKDRVFVFVHGYNVSFERAALTTAKLALDAGLGRDFAPVFFSWPSNGDMILTKTSDNEFKLAYQDDEVKAEAAEASAAFREFLALVNEGARGKKLTIVVHSMGHRFLTKEKNLEFLAGLNLDSVVSAGGDCDRALFQDRIKKLKKKGTNQMAAAVTVYTSLDAPLKLSKLLHGNQPRLGQGGAGTVRAFGNGDTVDVSEFVVPLRELGHSTVFRKYKPLNDLKLLLLQGRKTANNTTRDPATDLDGLPYWVLKKKP